MQKIEETALGLACRTAKRPTIAMISQALKACFGRVVTPVAMARMTAQAVMRVYPELEVVLLPGLASLPAASVGAAAQAAGQD